MLQGDDKAEETKNKFKIRHVSLPINIRGYGLSQQKLDSLMEEEVSFQIFL
jgi:hypothetical protein